MIQHCGAQSESHTSSLACFGVGYKETSFRMQCSLEEIIFFSLNKLILEQSMFKWQWQKAESCGSRNRTLH